MPLDPIAYKPYADPDDFIREVTDLIWVDRAIGYIRENYEPDSIVHGAYGTSDGSGRGHRGHADADLGDPGPHRSGRGRHLGGARRRRLPQLAPRAVGATPSTSDVISRTIANCLYRRGRMVEEWVVRDSLAGALAAGRGPRRAGARAGLPRLHRARGPRPAPADLIAVGRLRSAAGRPPPRGRAGARDDPAGLERPRPGEGRPTSSIRDLVLHTVGNRTVIRPEGYRRALLQLLAAVPGGQFEVRDMPDQLRRRATRDCGSP